MSEPRVAFLDCETTPLNGWAWGLWKQDIHIGQIQIPTHVMCFASRWYGEASQFFHEWGDYENEEPRSYFTVKDGLPALADWLAEPHEAMIRQAFDILDEADVVLHWNGDTFDVPHFTREFQEYGLGRPSPFISVDMMKGWKKGRHLSAKLEYASTQLGHRGKMQHSGFPLWLQVMAGSRGARRKMGLYNKRDVKVLNEIEPDLRHWLKYPNFALWGDDDGVSRCTQFKCQSTNLQRRGYATTRAGRFPRYQCQDCGAWMQSPKRESSTELRPL